MDVKHTWARGVCELCRDIRPAVVAAAGEIEAEAETLRALGFDQAQGDP